MTFSVINVFLAAVFNSN